MKLVVEQRFASLEKLILRAADSSVPADLSSHLCRLGAVLICGNIERCLELLILGRFETRSPPQVTTFLKRHFRRGTNYDCEEIKNLLYRFDGEWGRDFETYVANNSSVKERVSGCYAIRNSVAHGGGTNIGPVALKEYFNASFELVAELDNILR